MGGADKLGSAAVPDLANAPRAVRKRRAPKHDFHDGKGKVFAHRHDNGGGWVADTARVAASVKVTRNAQVFDFARIYDTCEISGYARVFGHAQLHHSARVFGNARVMDYAILCNTTSVGRDVTIFGGATISGASHFIGRVSVGEQVALRSVHVYGPNNNATTRIVGAARIYHSNLHGFCLVNGNALLDSATVCFTRATGNARISRGSINTVLPIDAHQWLTNGTGSFNEDLTANALSHIEGAIISSSYHGPRLRTSEDTLIASSGIWVAFTSSDAGPNWPTLELENTDVLMRVEGTLSLDTIRSRIHNGRNPLPIATPNIPQQNAYGAPAIPVRGTAPEPGTARQRRLIPLGG